MKPQRSLVLAAALLLAPAACRAGASSDSRTECSGSGAVAVTEIGSVPPGTVQGDLHREVKTGDRVTIAMKGPGRVVCRNGDLSVLKDVLRDLERDLGIDLD